MEPPPRPSSSPLFQVYLRLKPPTALSVSSTQGSIVYPSLRPTERYLTVEEPVGSDHVNPTHITVTPPRDSRKRAIEKFAFTKVFQEDAGQLDIFKGTGILPLIEGVLGTSARHGRDGLLATIGVTGSGKSHTMLGSSSQRGLTQLSLDVIFRSLGENLLDPIASTSNTQSLANSDASEAHLLPAVVFLDGVHREDTTPTLQPQASLRSNRLQRPLSPPQEPDVQDILVPIDNNMEYAILISMYEVYNDRIFDLLTSGSDGATLNSRIDRDLRRRPLLFKATEHSPDRKVVAGLRKIICATLAEALMVLETGLIERRVSGTGSNSVSSRSHGFFCAEVKRRRKHSTSPWSGSTLTVVDLAGSERARNAKTAGATLAEAGKINESLMYLGQCLQMQSDNSDGNKSSLVPFRQCKLTELLFSNSFPSASATASSHHPSYTHHQPQKAVMIVTADPLGDFNATSQILRYSALAREITVPRVPSIPSSVLSSMHARSASGSGRSTPTSPYPHEELEHAAQEIARLSEELDVMTFRMASEEKRRIEAEEAWRAADERCLHIERDAREECSAEMEKRMEIEMRRWKSAWGEEADRNDEHLDKKLGILTEAITIHEDPEPAVAERIRQLEDENDSLRRKLTQLDHELQGQSPTKKQVSGLVHSTSRASIFDSENIRPSMMGQSLSLDDSFQDTPAMPPLRQSVRLSSRSTRSSPRKPLTETTTSSLCIQQHSMVEYGSHMETHAGSHIECHMESHVDTEATMLSCVSRQADQSQDQSQDPCQSECGDSTENWAVIGSGRSTLSTFRPSVATSMSQMTLEEKSEDWYKTIKTPTKIPRPDIMNMGEIVSSPFIMDEATLKATRASSARKPAKTPAVTPARAPGTGRKIRKLTTRKWDFADEDELSD